MSKKVVEIAEFRKKVSTVKLKIADAQKKINELAKVSENIGYTNHAIERMSERGFVSRDVDRILRKGIIKKEPRQDERGCWRYKVEESSTRDAAVIVVIYDPNISIITVEWMD